MVRVTWPVFSFDARSHIFGTAKARVAKFCTQVEYIKPSMLLHCWLGHLTCKILSKTTYNVSSGTLNPTIPYLAMADSPPPIGHGQGHMTRFFRFCPNHIFGIGEARHFKFCVLIDTEEYYCMHDTLPLKGMRWESHDLFEFLNFGNKWDKWEYLVSGVR